MQTIPALCEINPIERKQTIDQSQRCVHRYRPTKLEHVLFPPTLSADINIGRFSMTHEPFLSADTFGRQYRPIKIARVSLAVSYKYACRPYMLTIIYILCYFPAMEL